MRSWPDLQLPELSKEFHVGPLSLFNTASSHVETLPKKSTYRMYVCGITPYDATHLGHAATYLTFDLINRYLLMMGSKVDFVQNITDIDDPLLERAQRDGVEWESLARSQIDLFRGDMTDLHVLPPQHYIGVVEAMSLVVTAIEKLQREGTTYSVDKDLYFRIHSDAEFGSRSHFSDEEKLRIFSERGGDPERKGKVNPFDALVWLAQRPGEPGWQSPFGMGRPGWHIECCAIALNFLKPDSSDEYAIDIQGVVKQLNFQGATIELIRAGGLHTAANPIFDEVFEKTLAANLPNVRMRVLDVSPVFGAVMQAAHRYFGTVSPEFITKLTNAAKKVDI